MPRLTITYPEKSIGEGDQRILLAYASKRGSTGEVAEVIAQTLWDKGGLPVDLRLVKHVDDISAYRAVIIGSAIRIGNWLGEAKDFVKRHQSALAQVPTVIFTVCITLAEDTPENRAEVDGYMDPIRELISPASVGAFAGLADMNRFNGMERLLMRVSKQPEGDFRDWDAIRAWAESLIPLL
ncbi:MAG: flavodoxin domain-containing protein [Anaerolineae bacterium]|nr:flavodoxin domain-containing protein [Anaerolineae bacterium]